MCVVVSQNPAPPKEVRISYPLAAFATRRHGSVWRTGAAQTKAASRRKGKVDQPPVMLPKAQTRRNGFLLGDGPSLRARTNGPERSPLWSPALTTYTPPAYIPFLQSTQRRDIKPRLMYLRPV